MLRNPISCQINSKLGRGKNFGLSCIETSVANISHENGIFEIFGTNKIANTVGNTDGTYQKRIIFIIWHQIILKFFFLTFFVDAMAAQLNSVRMKLEQRRKRIEEEKRKMETVMAKQREKVGQEAFLRAVVKGTVIRLTSN